MTISTTADQPAALRGPSTTVLAVCAWALGAILVLAAQGSSPPFLFTDDAMRLAQMRDLAQGQSWFVTLQARMSAPHGLLMHWPHYVDAAMLMLMRLLQLVAGSRAEAAMLALWPLLTALPLLLVMTRIGERLAGRDGALIAIALTATCATVTGIFWPGRIDHHNVQLALTMAMVLCLLEPERPRLFAAAGALGLFSVAIGLETLPYMLLASLLAAGLAILDGERNDRAVRAFGLAVAISGALFYMLAPDDARALPVCDAYSRFYAPIAVAGGVGLAALTGLPRHRASRGACLFALAAAILGLGYLLNPQCLGGPYARVSPMLDRVWLSRIEEAQPVWRFARLEPGSFVTGHVYALLCLAASLAMCALDRARRQAFAILSALSAGALLIALFEVRSISFAVLFGLPGLAAFLAHLFRAPIAPQSSRPARAMLVMLALFAASDATFALAGQRIAAGLGRTDAAAADAARLCSNDATLTALNALPAGRIAAYVDQGPGILVDTDHSALAGPYHRDAAGILDTYAIFAGAPDAARKVIARRGIAYLVTCRASPDHRYYARANPRGLSADIDRGMLPPWLYPVRLAGLDDAVRVFRIRH